LEYGLLEDIFLSIRSIFWSNFFHFSQVTRSCLQTL